MLKFKMFTLVATNPMSKQTIKIKTNHCYFAKQNWKAVYVTVKQD